MPGTSLIVYRGAELPLGRVHEAARRVLGGHLRPDAALIAHTSGPVRVDRSARNLPDPLAGTVRVVHLAVPFDEDEVLTDLSRMVLPATFGFPEEARAGGWKAFGQVVAESVALELSREDRGLAVLALEEDACWRGSYSLFGAGKRLWSAAFEAGSHYATWDGSALSVDAMALGDPPPVEGAPTDFPAHGLRLLFGGELQLTLAERNALLPSLWRASRPPTEGAEGMWLVEQGRFVAPGRPPSEHDWLRFTATLGG
jgi:hypothetical protein